MWYSFSAFSEVHLRYSFYYSGSLSLQKVQIITEIIIGYFSEPNNRLIIHSTIQLTRTFSIFTNVDKVVAMGKGGTDLNFTLNTKQ